MKQPPDIDSEYGYGSSMAAQNGSRAQTQPRRGPAAEPEGPHARLPAASRQKQWATPDPVLPDTHGYPQHPDDHEPRGQSFDHNPEELQAPAQEPADRKENKRPGLWKRFVNFVRGRPSIKVKFENVQWSGEGKYKGNTQGHAKRIGGTAKGKGVQDPNPKQPDRPDILPEDAIFGTTAHNAARQHPPRSPLSDKFSPHTTATGCLGHPSTTSKFDGRALDHRAPLNDRTPLNEYSPLRSHPVPDRFGVGRAQPCSTMNDSQRYPDQAGPSNLRQGGSAPAGYSNQKPYQEEQQDEEQPKLCQNCSGLTAVPRNHFDVPSAPDGCTFQEWKQLTAQNKPAVPNRVSSKLPWRPRSRLTMASSRRQRSICPSIASHVSWNPFNLPGPERVSSFADVLEFLRQKRESNANLNGNLRSANNNSTGSLLGNTKPITAANTAAPFPKTTIKPLITAGPSPLSNTMLSADARIRLQSPVGSNSSSRGAEWMSEFKSETSNYTTDATATTTAATDSVFSTRLSRVTESTLDSAVGIDEENGRRYRRSLAAGGSGSNDNGRPRTARGLAGSLAPPPPPQNMATLPDVGGESSAAEAWWRSSSSGASTFGDVNTDTDNRDQNRDRNRDYGAARAKHAPHEQFRYFKAADREDREYR